MPEAPEVETIHRQIRSELFMDSLQPGVVVPWTMEVNYQHDSTTNFQPARIVRTQRKGKWTVFYGEELAVVIHLKMSGQVTLLRSIKSEIEDIIKTMKHVRMILTFSHSFNSELSFRLIFADHRGFGVFQARRWIYPLHDISEITKLGIDPTYPDEFTLNHLYSNLSHSKKSPIAEALVMQENVAGIGNIYRSEILHAASVLPNRPVYTLDQVEFQRVYCSTISIINKAIEYNGCSMLDHRSTYIDIYGNKGRMASQLAVYQRDGMPCLSCGQTNILSRIIGNTRRVFYCSNCQV